MILSFSRAVLKANIAILSSQCVWKPGSGLEVPHKLWDEQEKQQQSPKHTHNTTHKLRGSEPGLCPPPRFTRRHFQNELGMDRGPKDHTNA